MQKKRSYQKIGISIYTIKELKKILSKFEIDLAYYLLIFLTKDYLKQIC